MSTLSLAHPEAQVKLAHPPTNTTGAIYGGAERPTTGEAGPPDAPDSERDLQESIIKMQEAERIVCQGWMYLLKRTSGVRQWKKFWMVLRPKSLTMYKNEEEYSAARIIPFGTIINAIETNAISQSKQYCMQIITEEKNYRLCASDEETWAKWLGALKSLLAKRRERKPQSAPENAPAAT